MKPDISVVFRCFRRPNLTELCLRRMVELLDGYDYETIMLYDGDDESYIKRMKEFCDFREVVSNPGKTLTMGDLLNRSYELCWGDTFMHFENDYYWINECIEAGLEALQYVDVVRLSAFPFHVSNAEKVVPLCKGDLWVFKKTTGFSFNLNPHLRQEKFPVGKFNSLGSWIVEPDYAKRFQESDKVGGCLSENNFIHLGIFDSRGGFNPQHMMYFLGYNWKGREDEFRPMQTFKTLTNNKEYIELFRTYLMVNGGEKWLE